MAERLKRNTAYLEVLSHGTPKQRNAILEGANDDLCKCLSEICQNVLRGCLDLSDEEKIKLKRHKKKLRTLGNNKIAFSHKKKIIRQSGGFLQVLAGPILGLLGNLVIGGIKKAVARRKKRRALARLKKVGKRKK